MEEDTKKMGKRASRAKKGWWKFQFIVAYKNEEKDPRWHIDPLIAYEILKPVMEKMTDSISFWRFHKVNHSQDGGHQFNFLIYCVRNIAIDASNLIKGNHVFQRLEQNKDFVKFVDPSEKRVKPGIEGQSEEKWPPYIKRTWQHYIMVLSKMWLELLELVREEIDFKETDNNIETMICNYQEIDKKLQEFWQRDCGHVIMHMAHSVMG